MNFSRLIVSKFTTVSKSFVRHLLNIAIWWLRQSVLDVKSPVISRHVDWFRSKRKRFLVQKAVSKFKIFTFLVTRSSGQWLRLYFEGMVSGKVVLSFNIKKGSCDH